MKLHFLSSFSRICAYAQIGRSNQPPLEIRCSVTSNYHLLVGEACSALCSAASEDLAAVSGGHSCTEAMHLLALTLLGLVGTKHVLHLLVLIWDFRIMRVPNYSTSAVPK